MGNVNDSAVIAQVFEAMGANPDLTRRAAIIGIAGEGSLRRIERMMAAMLESDPHALDTARRIGVHHRHASRFPCAAMDTNGMVGFAVKVFYQKEDTMTLFLGLKGTKLHASFDPGLLGEDAQGVPSIDVSKAERSVNAVDAQIINALRWHGILEDDDGDTSDLVGGFLCRNLAKTLVRDWKRKGLGEHLDPAILMSEAVALEERRLTEAGLPRLVNSFPANYRMALSEYARFVEAVKEPSFFFKKLSQWAMAIPSRMELLLNLEALASLVKEIETAPDEDCAPVEVVFRFIRQYKVDDRGPSTPDDAAWLLSIFGAGSGVPMLSTAHIRFALNGRLILEPVLRSKDERIAFVEIMRSLDLLPRNWQARFWWDMLLDAHPDRLVSFKSALTAFDEIGLEQGLTRLQVLAVFKEESFDFLATAWCFLVERLISREGSSKDLHAKLGFSKLNDLSRKIEVAALDLVSGNEGWKGLVAAVLAWRKDLRPGLTPNGDRDSEGRITAWALSERLEDEESKLMSDDTAKAFDEFLGEFLGTDRYAETLLTLNFPAPAPPPPSIDPERVEATFEPESIPSPASWWRKSFPLSVLQRLRRAA